MKSNLIAEYGFYRQSRINTAHYEDSIMFMSSIITKSADWHNENYTILKNPTDFDFADSINLEKTIFLQNVKADLKNYSYLKCTFLVAFTWASLADQIASFINTKGGNVYLCKL